LKQGSPQRVGASKAVEGPWCGRIHDERWEQPDRFERLNPFDRLNRFDRFDWRD